MHRAVDHGKDQSYVLGVLDQRAARPLAVPARRHQQAEGARGGRRAAGCWWPTSPTRHDICFVADGDNAGWLRDKLGDRNPNAGGDIVDAASGEVLGRHEGTVAYTIGQRRGLRLGRPAPDGRPRFVLDIEPVSGTVTVGPREGLRIDRITGIRPRWCGTVPDLLDGPEVTVQLRAHGAEHRAVVTVHADGVADRAARPGRGHRPRPGGRGLRRQPGRRAPPPSVATARSEALRVTTLASGVGSMPGTDDREYAEAVRVVLGELLPAARPRAARAGGARDHDRARPGRGRRARRRPAAGRLAADRRARGRPPARPLPAGPGPRPGRGAGPGARRPVQGPGLRPVDAGRDGREAARRQDPRPTTGPAATSRRRSPRGSATTSPTSAGVCPAPSGWSSRSTSRRCPRSSRARCRRPPASAGTGGCTRPRPRPRWSGC